MLITGSISQVGSKNKQNEGCLNDVSGVKQSTKKNNNKTTTKRRSKQNNGEVEALFLCNFDISFFGRGYIYLRVKRNDMPNRMMQLQYVSKINRYSTVMDVDNFSSGTVRRI